MMLQDRSGGHPSSSWPRTSSKFLAAARKRPELAERAPQLRAGGAAALRRGRQGQGAQAGRAASPTSTARCRPSWAAPTSTTSPASARQWKVFVQAEPRVPDQGPTTSNEFYVRNARGEMVPLSTLVTVRRTSAAPSTPSRFNLYPLGARSSARPAPGLQLRPGAGGARGGRRPDPAAGDGLRLERICPTRRRPPRAGRGGLRPVAGLRLPDPGRAVRELVAALQRAAQHADRGAGSVPGTDGPAVRLQRLRADRPGHAHRPRREERHPHRRVRQDAARAGEGRWSTRRSRERGCGCGRS